MEQSQGKHRGHDRIIDIPDDGAVSSSMLSSENPSRGSDLPRHEHARINNAEAPVVQSTSISSSTANTCAAPTVYKALICIKLTYKMSLIITAILVLIASRHEKPQNPWFLLIVFYTAGCAASLPIVFQLYFLPHPRLLRAVDCYRWMLEFFFSLWFVVANICVFNENFPAEARHLHRLCVVLLVFNYIKYLGPFVLYASILYCCSGLLNQIGGAPLESINALPTYKFKLLKDESTNHGEIDGTKHVSGVVAAGTERERALSGDDAVCCICLESYNDNDMLKELPCSHFFHATCVDTWLKIKAFCPLCKCRVGKSTRDSTSTSATNPTQLV